MGGSEEYTIYLESADGEGVYAVFGSPVVWIQLLQCDNLET